MMYKHKNLKQLLCCVLLLCLFCGSSLGFFSVKADTGDFVPVNFYAVYPQLTDGVLQGSIIVSTSAWNLTQTDVDYEYLYNFTEKTIKSWAYSEQTGTVGNTVGVGNNVVYNSGGGVLGNTSTMQKWNIFERDQLINIILTNQTSNVVVLSSAYPIIDIRSPKGHSFTDVQVVDSNNLSLRYINGYNIVLELGTGHYTEFGTPCLRPGEHVSITLSVHQSTYTTSTNTADSNTVQLPANDYPNSATIGNITGTVNTNVNPNDLVEYDTKVLSSQLQGIIQALTGDEGSVKDTINTQTEQQKEQYDAFSASTDSSDSNNINSAITGGTDAVKEKMGLFSFFDGIVSDLSDVLTKNHERHLVLPALDVPLPEETVHIWDRKEFDFDELENNFSAIITVVRFATVAVCYVTMINGAYHLFHKFIGVKDSDA